MKRLVVVNYSTLVKRVVVVTIQQGNNASHRNNRMLIKLCKIKMLLIYHLISPLIRAITIMNSVRAKFCGRVEFFEKKVKEGGFLKLLVANRPCRITYLIYLY